MKTSKISQETAKLLKANSSPRSTRNTRSTLSRFAHNASVKNDTPVEAQQTALDIEDVVPFSRKRKRDSNARIPTARSPKKSVVVKTEVEESVTFSPLKERKVRKPARQIKNEETGEVEIHSPNDWAEVYAAVKTMRISGPAQNAAVDTMGCERLGQNDVPPKVKRFQTLIALMLSSQTKDTTNAMAMKRLQTELPAYKEGEPVGLNLENILAVDPKLLNELIWVVGFHNNKTKYIKAAAEILRDTWSGDIPDTIEGLMSLPGVGPKMAYLCMSAAWGRTEGIGVDVHVHRITNLWGWHKTKGPEESRVALQAWLPKELWHEINWLLVGFGQTVCLPVGRKCGDCDVGLKGLCKSAERSKVAVGRKLREEKVEEDDKGGMLLVTDTIKSEEVEDMPVNVNAKVNQVEGGEEFALNGPSIKKEEGSTGTEEAKEVTSDVKGLKRTKK